MTLEKKYPADIKIPQDSESLVKFLYSKEIDAELYSYLLSISVGFKEERISAQGYIEMVGHTVIYKQNMPTGLEMAEHLTPKGNSQKVSKATANRHFKKLMDYGYIKKEKDYYEILNPEDSFLMVPLDTINFLLDNLRPHVFKTFIYLVQRNKFKENYEFTISGRDYDNIGSIMRCANEYCEVNNDNLPDIEYIKERDIKKLSEYFDRRFESLEDFYKFWTTKEATYKSTQCNKYILNQIFQDCYYLTFVGQSKSFGI